MVSVWVMMPLGCSTSSSRPYRCAALRNSPNTVRVPWHPPFVFPLRSPRLGRFPICGQPVELPAENEKPNHHQHAVDGVRDAQDGDECFTDDADRAGGDAKIGHTLRKAASHHHE